MRSDIFLADGMHLNALGYTLWDPLVRSKILDLTHTAKIHQLSSVLYAKFRSQLFIANQAMGQEMIKAMPTQITNTLFSITITWEIWAPFIFLIPISFLRQVIE